MGISVANEVYVFLSMVLVGMALVFLLDIFRIMRKILKMGTVLVAVTDFIFFIAFSVLLIGGLLYFNDGNLRWYEFSSLILGGIIYLCLFSRAIIAFFIKIIAVITNIIGYILKILLTPLVFLYKILIRPIINIFSCIVKRCRKSVTFGVVHLGRMICFKRKEGKAVAKDKRGKKTSVKKAKKKHSIGVWIVIALVGAAFINSMMMQPKILKNKETIAELEQQLEYEKLRAKEVDALREKVDTDEYIEKVARDRLGLIKENEMVFIDVAD